MAELLINYNRMGWCCLILIGLLVGFDQEMPGDSILYQTLNIIGAIMLITNSFYFGAYPSVGVNIAWVGIALMTLIKSHAKASAPSQPQ